MVNTAARMSNSCVIASFSSAASQASVSSGTTAEATAGILAKPQLSPPRKICVQLYATLRISFSGVASERALGLTIATVARLLRAFP
jgi:hypothetical protein